MGRFPDTWKHPFSAWPVGRSRWRRYFDPSPQRLADRRLPAVFVNQAGFDGSMIAADGIIPNGALKTALTAVGKNSLVSKAI
jgi:hypothetical protein